MAESIRYDELNNDCGSYSEMELKRQEIQSTFSYEGCKIIREELFAHVRNPAVTIRPDGIMFIAIFKNLTNTSKSETNADNQKE